MTSNWSCRPQEWMMERKSFSFFTISQWVGLLSEGSILHLSILFWFFELIHTIMLKLKEYLTKTQVLNKNSPSEMIATYYLILHFLRKAPCSHLKTRNSFLPLYFSHIFLIKDWNSYHSYAAGNTVYKNTLWSLLWD